MTARHAVLPLQAPTDRGRQSTTTLQHPRLDPEVSRDLLMAHGRQSSSYFSLQQACHHFHHPHLGYIAYTPVRTFWGLTNVVITNPVAAPDRMGALISAFESTVPGRPLYVGIDGEAASRLSGLGHRTTMMGTEFVVDLEDFTLEGRAMKQLRHASNLHRRENVQVQELIPSADVMEQASAISDSWRQSKVVKDRELRLLTRPPEFGMEWGVRRFFAYHQGRMVGYVFFDPYYEHGRIKGYCANILRSDPGVKIAGLLDHIVLRAMSVFREEGVRELSLGIAPLHGVREAPGEQRLLRYTNQWLYEHGNRLYAFRALAYHKSRYRAREEPWYLCARNLSTPAIAWVLLKGTGVLS